MRFPSRTQSRPAAERGIVNLSPPTESEFAGQFDPQRFISMKRKAEIAVRRARGVGLRTLAIGLRSSWWFDGPASAKEAATRAAEMTGRIWGIRRGFREGVDFKNRAGGARADPSASPERSNQLRPSESEPNGA